MRRTIVFASVGILTLLVAPIAQATLDLPIKLRLKDGRLAAHAGETYRGVVQIVVPDGVDAELAIENLRIESQEGWRNAALAMSKASDWHQAGVHEIPFTALVEDPAQPLIVVVDVNGRSVGRSFLMSEEAILDRTSPIGLVQLEGSQLIEFQGVDNSLPKPEPSPRDAVDVEEKPSGEFEDPNDRSTNKHDRNIRVYGRFAYRRTDNQVVGVDGAIARVYDDDWCCDELLAEVATDAWGNFDVTFGWDPCWTCDGEPDIYVEFELDNSVVQVQADDILEEDYTFETGIWGDYDGNSLHVGTQIPGDWFKMASCHIHTSIVRAWRWMLVQQGRNMPQVDVQWPSGDNGAKYNDFFEEIHISGERSWSEFTHIHEYGHHFVENFAINNTPDYCNGVCDTAPNAWWPFEDCGHCFWCGETNHDAFNEGFPDWMGDVITKSFSAYPPGPLMDNPNFYPNMEMLAMCNMPGGSSDPQITEGPFAAMLLDITDNGQDDEPSQALGRDVLNLPTQDIFNLVDWDHPTNPADFIDKFRARYPAQTENFWQTAANNGYNFDTQKPGIATNLRAPSHFLGGEVPDTTMDVAWDRPPDDASGVDAYSYVISQWGPIVPDTNPEPINGTSFTHPTALSPGWWWITLRGRDRTGKWSDDYAIAGPYGVRNPDPADLMMLTHSGWNYHSVLPRSTADAPSPAYSLSASAVLWGNDSGLYQSPFTYTNVNYWNQGEVYTNSPFYVSMFVDGAIATYHYEWQSIGPHGLGWKPVLNHPMTVRGGRHIISARVDDTELLAEPNELNNEWGRQWGFSAWHNLNSGPAWLPAPPGRYAAANTVIDGSPIYENSLGGVFYANNSWTAITMRANGAADYDMRLHNLDFNPYSAFGASVASSNRLAGQLDAVFMNMNTLGGLTYWNVGVINWNNSNEWFELKKIVNGSMNYGDTVAASFAEGEMLQMWQIYVAPGQVGTASIIADVSDATQGPVYVAWLRENFTVGGLSSAAATGVSDASGHISFSYYVPNAGYHCLVAYRDPGLPSAKRGTGPVNLTLRAGGPLSDFYPMAASGWAKPLVPRPLPDAQDFVVPAPLELYGDQPSYVSFAIGNAHFSQWQWVDTLVNLDGIGALAQSVLDSPWWFASYSLSQPLAVSGGRHVLSMAADAWNGLPELNESNNAYGEAWVWTPQTLSPDTQVLRSPYADPTTGWGEVTTGEVLWSTCDAVRTPVVDVDGQGIGSFGALAIFPIGHDVDLALHELSVGPKDGFTIPIVSSGWGANQCDYVLVNSRLTNPRAFDAALTGVGLQGVAAPTLVEFVPSKRILPNSAVQGPFAMDDILDLYEVPFEIGPYRIQLQNAAGTIDWGMTVHRADVPFQNRSTSFEDAIVNFSGPGGDEGVLVDITTAGSYAIAVWKSLAGDAQQTGSYELVVGPNPTSTPDEPALAPSRTALVQAQPNPFNPRTTVSFDLARTGRVRVDVFSLRGQHIRTLLDEARPAGRHEVIWTGDDDAGQQVASGVYTLRLAADGVLDQQKLVLVK